eukprot:7326367-Prymnesium_polylepis.1
MPFWDERFSLPTVPSLWMPTCGAKSTSILPGLERLSGTWCEYAVKPGMPVNGMPPSPPSEKYSP